MTAWTTPKARLDAYSGVEGWQLRDLRRTCRTGMAGLGVAPHIGERVLNHAAGVENVIARTYNRHKHEDEKRAALDAWGREVERIVTGKRAKVIALR